MCVGAIVGIAVGGVVVLAAIVVLIVVIHCQKGIHNP